MFSIPSVSGKDVRLAQEPRRQIRDTHWFPRPLLTAMGSPGSRADRNGARNL